MNNEELIKFCKASASASLLRNFSKNSSNLQHTAYFHNFAHISEKKTDRIFTIFLSQIHLGAKKSPLNFAIHPDSESGPDWPLQRSARSGCSLSLFFANFVLLVQNVPRLLMRLSNHYSSYASPFKVAEALMALSSNLTQLLTCLLNI